MRRTKLASLAAVIVAVILASSSLTAQQPPKTLQFEVATIKPGTPRKDFDSHSSGGAPGGRYEMINVPLKQWVMMGLSVRDYALRAPSWLETSRFDLNATVPVYKPGEHKNATGEMIKALLIERFGLKWHEELQTASGFELVTDKKVTLQPASLLERLFGTGGSSSGGGTLIKGTNMSMSDLAGALSDALGKPVVDATHLAGGYDISLRWRPSDETDLAQQRQYGKQYGYDVDSLSGSVGGALREQLGLRLQPARVQTKVTIVDNINRQPTGN